MDFLKRIFGGSRPRGLTPLERLVTLAYGDIDLVQSAIRNASRSPAPIQEVVDYVMANRGPKPEGR